MLRVLRAFANVFASVLLLLGCDGGEGSEPRVVDPADTSRAAVQRDLGALVSMRLLEGAEVDEVSRVHLLCWELRSIPEREAPSDLALVLAEYSSAGQTGFALGQAFRHREGSIVEWQWFVVRDPTWLELRLFPSRPTRAEVDAFLTYWDFVLDGENGRLLAGICPEAAWRDGLGLAAPAYPAGTPDPELAPVE